MRERMRSERLVNILSREDSGIPNEIFEILKRDITKLLGEYLELYENSVEMLSDSSADGIKISLVVRASGVKKQGAIIISSDQA